MSSKSCYYISVLRNWQLSRLWTPLLCVLLWGLGSDRHSLCVPIFILHAGETPKESDSFRSLRLGRLRSWVGQREMGQSTSLVFEPFSLLKGNSLMGSLDSCPPIQTWGGLCVCWKWVSSWGAQCPEAHLQTKKWGWVEAECRAKSTDSIKFTFLGKCYWAGKSKTENWRERQGKGNEELEKEMEWRQMKGEILAARKTGKEREEGGNEKERRVVDGKSRRKRESRQKGESISKGEGENPGQYQGSKFRLQNSWTRFTTNQLCDT